MRLQGAIFDMDGTLLDSMFMWKDLAPRVVRRLGGEPEPGLREAVKPMTLRQAAAYCRDRHGLTQTVDQVIAECEAIMEEFYRHEVQAKPGVDRFLSLLKLEGVEMYVATATDRPLAEAALEQAGIRRYFRGLVTCGEAGAGKDTSPAVYQRALRRLRTSLRDTVVFEDALHAVRTAKAAGFRVAAVYDATVAEQETLRELADYYIRSFEEMYDTAVF